MENPQRTPTFLLWESGTLAEDKGILWNPNLGLHRVGHFRDTLSIKHDMK